MFNVLIESSSCIFIMERVSLFDKQVSNSYSFLNVYYAMNDTSGLDETFEVLFAMWLHMDTLTSMVYLSIVTTKFVKTQGYTVEVIRRT